MKALAVAAAGVVGMFAASEILRHVDTDSVETRVRRIIDSERYANWVDRVWRRDRGAVVWEAMEVARVAAEEGSAQ